MKKFAILICISFNCVLLQAQTLQTPNQNLGLPYTRTAKAIAIKKINNHIAVFSGSRYAWVNGFKVRLDDKNWRDEAITKNGEVFVPLTFASILSLKEIKIDSAPAYLSDKWVHTIQRPEISLKNIKKVEINGRPYVSFTDASNAFGLKLYQHQGKLLIAGKNMIQFSTAENTLLEAIITQFDTPEKFADPDIATKYIPTLAHKANGQIT